MSKIFISRVQQKRDTEANWIANNPILLNGELIFVDMSNGSIYMKVGDGVSNYNSLPFVTFGNGSSGEEDMSAVTDLMQTVIDKFSSVLSSINGDYQYILDEVTDTLEEINGVET